jgi:hypothetical protein
VQTRTAAVVAGAVAAVALLGAWNVRAGFVAVGAMAAAVAVMRNRSIPPEEMTALGGEGWAFAGERIAFRPVSEVLDRRPREIAERLAARYRAGFPVEMILWVVATDGTGQPWTIVQDRFGDAVPSFTASAVGVVPGACDPYLEAQRLSLTETGLALADVLVVGWGVDTSLDARRDVIIVIGRASAGVEQLGSHGYEGGGRRSHLVELHPDSVARSLASVDARRWQAGAVRGLVQCLEVLYPGSGPLLEELVADPWRSRRMFTRLGRLTGGPESEERQPGPVAEPALHEEAPPLEPVVRDPVVLKVIDGGLSEEVEVRKPIPHDRALSWEGTSRAVPTRYR